ncbi:hypothetical protein ACFQ4L_06680 [Lapidilactobacillus mulanensis]|uniref:Uncharacterized protein n=1 Tax=Lapidilactobacillus mulanensis TaxID=2485999 RepID=A0ABW4DPU6_9LACO|nr:hypothetical protein [Lapidilactobacillus mulanensis]
MTSQNDLIVTTLPKSTSLSNAVANEKLYAEPINDFFSKSTTTAITDQVVCKDGGITYVIEN